MNHFHHIPIMVNEIIGILQPERGGIFVDGTLGGGGHAKEVLSLLPQDAALFGIDRDQEAIAAAKEKLQPFGSRFTAIHGNFFHMRTLLQEKNIGQVNGILLDLGVSSHQLDTVERGFSYHESAPLDMRMDKSAPLSAYDVVNGYDSADLYRIIKDYGEERFASRIANKIVQARANAPISDTVQLAELIKSAIPASTRREGPHPARRTFQAIRIEVNGELDGLEQAVLQAVDLLQPGGRLCILTFHSLEDRIVKQAFRSLENPCTCPPKSPVCVCNKRPVVRILTKKPIIASDLELEENQRARSAKLRAIEKLLV